MELFSLYLLNKPQKGGKKTQTGCTAAEGTCLPIWVRNQQLGKYRTGRKEKDFDNRAVFCCDTF